MFNFHEPSRELLQYVRDKEIELSQASIIRNHSKVKERELGYRTNADRDHARVLYSSAFRRLQDKMQLFAPKQSRFHRNRLTHSLEVAEIAKVIATKLKLNDTLTVQTCSLAHDIGNPPFGHYGEEILDNLVKPLNSRFEGNAQTFRVLTKLEVKHHDYIGLNLTWRTLFGVIKYPNDFNGREDKNKEKFLYIHDWATAKKSAQKLGVRIENKVRTIDAEIMDIADEIAYAAHDLQDALKQGYFSIDELIYEFSTSTKYKGAKNILEVIVKNAKKFASRANFCKTSEEYSSLFLKELTSLIVDTLVNSVDIKDNQLDYGENYNLLAEGLKKLTYNAVCRKRDIKQYELMGEKVIRGLFQVYMDQNFNRDAKLLPMDYIHSYDLQKDPTTGKFLQEQLVIPVTDYIAGMMDSFAIEQYKIYFGANSLDQIYFKEEQFNFCSQN